MKKLIKSAFALSLVASLSLFAVPAEAATNLVLNGGFEAPVVGTSQLWDIYLGPVTDWTIEWMPSSGGGNDPKLELHRGVNGWLPQEGSQYAELDTDWLGPTDSGSGEAASVRIYQDVPTEAQCTYNFSFWFSPRPDTGTGDNVLKAFWDGTQQGSDITAAGGSQTAWTQSSFSAVASGPTTRIQFEDHGTANSLGTFLDNVSVEKVSCPPPPPPPCNCGDVKVKNTNFSFVSNRVESRANTGDNHAGGAKGGNGGNAGDIDSDDEVEDSTTGNGGNGGAGGIGGTIVTGNAHSRSKAVNVVNTNFTRIRTRAPQPSI